MATMTRRRDITIAHGWANGVSPGRRLQAVISRFRQSLESNRNRLDDMSQLYRRILRVRERKTM